jgi:aspartyl-tRNA(Asn)/glutamyl-tRNA(Gln) amidotransferase subunit B
VSLMRRDAGEYGTRVELKNINSFRFVKQAIEFEIARQAELLDGGGRVVQETRLWDAQRGETRSMRTKEEAHDYRYFPEPDLPPLQVQDAEVDQIRAELPELPRAKLARFRADYDLPDYDAKILVGDRALADFFDACASEYREYKKLSNWFLGEFLRASREAGAAVSTPRFSPPQFASLLKSIDAGEISNNAGKDVFGEMFRTGKDPRAIIAERGFAQVSDTSAIEAVVDDVLARNAGEVEKYRAGKKNLFGFFVGQAMKAMKGKANPAVVNELLKKKLGE